jgi:hypothetical protein
LLASSDTLVDIELPINLRSNDRTRDGYPLWKTHLPELRKVKFLAWEAHALEPRQEVRDFCIRHVEEGQAPLYEFTRDRSYGSVRFGVAVGEEGEKRLTASELVVESEEMFLLMKTHLDRLETSLKNLTLTYLVDTGNGKDDIQDFSRLITQFNNGRNGAPAFQLDRFDVSVGSDVGGHWEGVEAQEITGLIDDFQVMCGLSVKSWIGCTPPVKIPAEDLAVAFGKYKLLEDITIDIHVLEDRTKGDEYALTLAKYCSKLREVNIRPSFSGRRATSGLPPNGENVITRFQIGRAEHNGCEPFIKNRTQYLETEEEMDRRTPKWYLVILPIRAAEDQDP